MEEDFIIFKREDLEVRCNDVVRLTNGMTVMVSGPMFQITNENVSNDGAIFLSTTPISSHISICYPEHIEKVIAHCGTFDKQMEWWKENGGRFDNPLHIELKRN